MICGCRKDPREGVKQFAIHAQQLEEKLEAAKAQMGEEATPELEARVAQLAVQHQNALGWLQHYGEHLTPEMFDA